MLSALWFKFGIEFYSLNKYLWRACFMPGTVLGTWDVAVKKTPHLDESTYWK